MPEIREITSGLEFPEGPVAMDDGSVLVVEVKRGTLTRVRPDGKKEVVAETGGGPNGAAIGPDGMVYICNNGGIKWAEDGGPAEGLPAGYKGGSIQRVDLASGKVATLYTECNGHPLRGPNDIVFDATGGFWFTDFGKVEERQRDRTAVYYAKPDGSLIKEMVFPIDGPNGVGLAPSDKKLYVAQTFEGRVWQWDIPRPGELARATGEGGPLLAGPGGGKLLAGLPGYQLLDSLAVDSAGNVCVATLINGGITVISPEGAVVEFIPTGDPLTTNICFGGPDLKTAYMTLTGTGKLVAMDWPRPGLKPHYTR
ncbi:MAG TPA: SMP-30/gluconolactonase/LRE family protein [Candidatus Binatia bacterium]|jgi:gluconolactonase|nr:SMP-30/gluconolactonase/LRE family protein [Candidatus Binatia bacterium]